MDTKKLKEKLHQYIDDATEDELEEMLFLVEEDEVEYEVKGVRRKWWEDEEFVKELERRSEEIESGKVKGVPWEEVHKEALERIKQGRDGK